MADTIREVINVEQLVKDRDYARARAVGHAVTIIRLRYALDAAIFELGLHRSESDERVVYLKKVLEDEHA